MLLFLCGSTTVFSQVLKAKDFGLLPNTFTDAAPAIQKLMHVAKEQSAKRIEFEPGRYDFWPEHSFQRELYITNSSSETEWKDKTKHIALLIEDMKNLTLDGKGAEFVMHGKMTSFSTIRSENIRIENLTFKFDRPTMSEMTVEELSANHMIAEVNPTSSYTIIDGKLYWYGPGWTPGDKQHTVTTDTATGISQYSADAPLVKAKVRELSKSRLRFDGEMHASYKVGEILSMRNTVRDEVGAFVYRSKNVTLFNLTMHYMHGIGITSQFSENLHYENINVVPVAGRATAAFADGMQFSGCKGQIKVHNCHFKGLHDDPINIHGTYLQIVEILSPNELVVEFKHHQSYGFDAFAVNDTVQVVTKEAIQPLGTMKVAGVEALSLTKIKLNLEGELPAHTKLGDVLENMTWSPAVDIRHNRFEGTNTRGLLVTTPRKVWIEDNTFYRTGMHGIQIAADVNSWFESGAVTDVTITGNRFIECGYNQGASNFPIAIIPEDHSQVKGHYVHRNITIIDNEFEVFSPHILRAKSTSGLTLTGNKITYTGKSFPLQQYARTDGVAISLENCEKVVIKSNEVDAALDLRVETKDMTKKDIKTDIKLVQ